ncbi:MAG: hypothetical protein FJW39_26580 [Acidobacteria bacterium]|nr:hypothetical protein [Acidobacteriota bacterium]
MIAVLLTLSGAIVAWRSFLGAERWKKAEFLAREMKDFFSDEKVRRALLMVDWGGRAIKLLDDHAPNRGMVYVTRDLQVQALRPHILMPSGADEIGDGEFTPEQAAIRDHYDVLLDAFERFGNFVKTGLVTTEMLTPYIRYWIRDIHAAPENDADAAWTAALLTYIDFYGYDGVQHLFKAFDMPVTPDSIAYRRALDGMKDQGFAARLRSCAPGKP